MEPKLLTSLSGEAITSRMMWEKYRREECMHLLEHYVYGERPIDVPDSVTFDVKTVNEDLEGMLLRHVTITCDGFSFTARAFSPKDAKENVPVFVYCMHEGQEKAFNIDVEPNTVSIPITDIARRGFGVVVYYVSQIYPEHMHHPNFEEGVFKTFSPRRDRRKDSDWATISAWSFAASRVVDFIMQDSIFSKKNIAVCGQSRSGKVALWAGATDPRFSLVISNSSGCTGAAMLRGKEGEHIEYIAHTKWFCERYNNYIEYEEMLPVDQHFLLAMMAPRLLYVQSSAEDDWSDPVAERRACRLASDVYRLYGKFGAVLPEEKDIKVDTAYHYGNIGYHMRSGEHNILAEDWGYFMNFWEPRLML